LPQEKIRKEKKRRKEGRKEGREGGRRKEMFCFSFQVFGDFPLMFMLFNSGLILL
jgi:hypothetical protein